MDFELRAAIALGRNAKDLTLQQFGKLHALRPVGRNTIGEVVWECLCECGTKKDVPAGWLTHTKGPTCGCSRRPSTPDVLRSNAIDRAGKRFGRLLVLRSLGSDGRCIRWECRCDCGTITAVRSAYLSRETTHSCGCYRLELLAAVRGNARPTLRLPGSEAAKRRVIKDYRKNARYRGLEWALTDEEAVALFRSACHYCGSEPKQVQPGNAGCLMESEPLIYNGIDRKDNRLGYLPTNVLPCCGICNRAKRAGGYEEFLTWIARAHRHLRAAGLIEE